MTIRSKFLESRRLAPYLLIGLGYVALYAVVGWALRGQPLALSVFGNVGLLLPPIAVCAIILRRRSRWDGCQRLFWDTIAISIGLWIIGHFGWAFDEIFLGRRSWLQWHTVFSLCGGIGPLIALLARPHRGVRGDAVGHGRPRARQLRAARGLHLFLLRARARPPAGRVGFAGHAVPARAGESGAVVRFHDLGDVRGAADGLVPHLFLFRHRHRASASSSASR